MSILLKEYPIVPIGGEEIEIKELSIKNFRSAKSDLVKIVNKFFKELDKLKDIEASDEKAVSNGMSKIIDMVLDVPYESVKIFVPSIKKEVVEEATPREILNLLEQAIEVNGFLLMKEKMGILNLMRI
ncbi:hypothetical protein [Anaeromicrobium sediminis]|uniref:Uncharacterized protein n=1 Tax=Anaeromicrobium sediminis TaxID=1478221 RepID=A0A267MNZ3_9FIRM|nr:hypothetical protein [Anaeromicrobium sediminis]PAB61319.1 hypothetical protein CCE28_02485 [Anaeromicrobium sediminis]